MRRSVLKIRCLARVSAAAAVRMHLSRPERHKERPSVSLHTEQFAGDSSECVFDAVNEICPLALLGEGRVCGGGLHKLEPKELGNVPVTAIAELLPASAQPQEKKQGELDECASGLRMTLNALGQDLLYGLEHS